MGGGLRLSPQKNTKKLKENSKKYKNNEIFGDVAPLAVRKRQNDRVRAPFGRAAYAYSRALLSHALLVFAMLSSLLLLLATTVGRARGKSATFT